jgi:hypothetical protein
MFHAILIGVLREEKLGAFFFGLGGADDEAVFHFFNNDGFLARRVRQVYPSRVERTTIGLSH